MKIKFLFLIVLLAACEKKGGTLEGSFEQVRTISIESKPVGLDTTISFSAMFKMASIDDLIVVSEIRDPEYDLKIVNLETGKIQRFAKRGKGPNEIKYRGVNFSVDHNNNRLFLIDGENTLVYAVDSLKEGSNTPIRTFSFDKNVPRMSENVYCQKSIVGITADQTYPHFGVYNINNNYFFEEETPHNELLPEGILNNQIFLVSHPHKNLVAYFHYSSGICGILTLKNNNLEVEENFYWATPGREIQSGNKTSVDSKKGRRNGFITATSDENYFYALYSGKSTNVNSMKELTNTFLTNEVYVFDWDGRPVKKYILDQEVRSITIDQKKNILYAASYENDIPHLIKFEL